MFKHAVIALAALAAVGSGAVAADLNVYGPGGPLPAMKEAAAAFGKLNGIEVNVTAGPTSAWIDKAREDADLIFSGSETMMTDFVAAMNGQVRSEEVEPLYLRAASILVRPGNPRQIRGLSDLMKPGMKVLVVQGAGQNGLWEDVAGRTGRIEEVRRLRANIAFFSPNSAAAKQKWTEDQTFDAWIIWNIWQVANPTLADTVDIDADHRVYRDVGVVPSARGREKPNAAAFVAFLKSPEGARIFQKWGWITPAS
ncbi:extracellular solute-binding protein [Xanthobacter autotrophicus]|uniref:substrate-binding domain-containing protein n=1 Tax=Xanthobacter TaxID=279 RepID=UPI0024AA8577|nr:substrate-binding domain-containing protein [Xanthobacter autotrophicus]MDI4663481.1 extracellular solute-binding protein [Xanthobacter autotrophicus]